MFVGVAPSLTLFRYYFVLRPTGRDVGIGGYYFQHRRGTNLPFIQTFHSAHWDRWREDWVIVETETVDRLRPSTSAPAGDRTIWEEAPEMDEQFGPVLTRIAELGTAGLTSTMVAADFLRRRIAPLQERTRPAWLYTGLEDATRLARGRDSVVDDAVLTEMLRLLTNDHADASSTRLPERVVPLCENRDLFRSAMAQMPTCDHISIARIQRGDESQGTEIHDPVDGAPRPARAEASGRGGKGKERAAPETSTSRAPPQVEVKQEPDTAPAPGRRHRLRRGDGSFVSEPRAGDSSRAPAGGSSGAPAGGSGSAPTGGSPAGGSRTGGGSRSRRASSLAPGPVLKKQRTEGQPPATGMRAAATGEGPSLPAGPRPAAASSGDRAQSSGQAGAQGSSGSRRRGLAAAWECDDAG